MTIFVCNSSLGKYVLTLILLLLLLVVTITQANQLITSNSTNTTNAFIDSERQHSISTTSTFSQNSISTTSTTPDNNVLLNTFTTTATAAQYTLATFFQTRTIQISVQLASNAITQIGITNIQQLQQGIFSTYGMRTSWTFAPAVTSLCSKSVNPGALTVIYCDTTSSSYNAAWVVSKTVTNSPCTTSRAMVVSSNQMSSGTIPSFNTELWTSAIIKKESKFYYTRLMLVLGLKAAATAANNDYLAEYQNYPDDSTCLPSVCYPTCGNSQIEPDSDIISTCGSDFSTEQCDYFNILDPSWSASSKASDSNAIANIRYSQRCKDCLLRPFIIDYQLPGSTTTYSSLDPSVICQTTCGIGTLSPTVSGCHLNSVFLSPDQCFTNVNLVIPTPSPVYCNGVDNLAGCDSTLKVNDLIWLCQPLDTLNTSAWVNCGDDSVIQWSTLIYNETDATVPSPPCLPTSTSIMYYRRTARCGLLSYPTALFDDTSCQTQPPIQYKPTTALNPCLFIGCAALTGNTQPGEFGSPATTLASYSPCFSDGQLYAWNPTVTNNVGRCDYVWTRDAQCIAIVTSTGGRQVVDISTCLGPNGYNEPDSFNVSVIRSELYYPETRCTMLWLCTSPKTSQASSCDQTLPCTCASATYDQNPQCYGRTPQASIQVVADSFCLSTSAIQPDENVNCVSTNSNNNCYSARCAYIGDATDSHYPNNIAQSCDLFNTTDVCIPKSGSCGVGTWNTTNVAVDCYDHSNLLVAAPDGATCTTPICSVPCTTEWRCSLTPALQCASGEDPATRGCIDFINDFGWTPSSQPSAAQCDDSFPTAGLLSGFCGENIELVRSIQCYFMDEVVDGSTCSDQDIPSASITMNDISGCSLYCYDQLSPEYSSTSSIVAGLVTTTTSSGNGFVGDCANSFPLDNTTCSTYCSPGQYHIQAVCQLVDANGRQYPAISGSQCSSLSMYSHFAINQDDNTIMTTNLQCFNASNYRHNDLVINFQNYESFFGNLSTFTTTSSCTFQAACAYEYVNDTLLTLDIPTTRENSFYANELSIDNCLADLDCTRSTICGTVQRQVTCQYTYNGQTYNFTDWQLIFRQDLTFDIDLSQVCQSTITTSSCQETSNSHCYSTLCALGNSSLSASELQNWTIYNENIDFSISYLTPDQLNNVSNIFTLSQCNSTVQSTFCDDRENCGYEYIPIYQRCYNRMTGAITLPTTDSNGDQYCGTYTSFNCLALQTCLWQSQTCGWQSVETGSVYTDFQSDAICSDLWAAASSSGGATDVSDIISCDNYPLCGKATAYTQCIVADPVNASITYQTTQDRCARISTFAQDFKTIPSAHCSNYDMCSSWVCSATHNYYVNMTAEAYLINSTQFSSTLCSNEMDPTQCTSCGQEYVYRSVGCLTTPISTYSSLQSRLFSANADHCGSSEVAPFATMPCFSTNCQPNVVCEGSTDYSSSYCAQSVLFQCPSFPSSFASVTNSTEYYDYEFPVRCVAPNNQTILPSSACSSSMNQIRQVNSQFNLSTNCSLANIQSYCTDNIATPIDFSVASDIFAYNATTGQYKEIALGIGQRVSNYLSHYGTNCSKTVSLRDIIFQQYPIGVIWPSTVTSSSKLTIGQTVLISWQFAGPNTYDITFYLVPTEIVTNQTIQPLPQILASSYALLTTGVSSIIPASILPGKYALLGFVDKRTFAFYAISNSIVVFTIDAAKKSTTSSSIVTSPCANVQCGNGQCIVNSDGITTQCQCNAGFSGSSCLESNLCIQNSNSFCANGGVVQPSYSDTSAISIVSNTQINCTSCWCPGNYIIDDQCQTCGLQCGLYGTPNANCTQCQCSNQFITGQQCECKTILTTLSYLSAPPIVQSLYARFGGTITVTTANDFESSMNLTLYEQSQLTAWKALIINDFCQDLSLSNDRVSVYNYGTNTHNNHFIVVLAISSCQPYQFTLTNTTIMQQQGYEVDSSTISDVFSTLPLTTANTLLAQQQSYSLNQYIANITSSINTVLNAVHQFAPKVAITVPTFNYSTLSARWAASSSVISTSQDTIPLSFQDQTIDDAAQTPNHGDYVASYEAHMQLLNQNQHTSSLFNPLASSSSSITAVTPSQYSWLASPFYFTQSSLATGPSSDVSGGFVSIGTTTNSADCTLSGKRSSSCGSVALSTVTPKRTKGNDNSFPTGAIVGIVVGVIVILIFIAVIVVCCAWIHQMWCFTDCKKRMKERRKERQRQRRKAAANVPVSTTGHHSDSPDKTPSAGSSAATATSQTNATIQLSSPASALTKANDDQDDEYDWYDEDMYVLAPNESYNENRRASLHIGGMRRISMAGLPEGWSVVTLNGKQIYINEKTLQSSEQAPSTELRSSTDGDNTSQSREDDYANGW